MLNTIRPITEQDAAAIARLSGQLGYATSASAMAQRIRAVMQDKDHCSYAATAEEEVVGWIHGCYTLRLESDAFVEIAGLVVAEQYRSQGLGSMLIEEVAQWARGKGVGRLRVRCNTKRTATHAFYRHIGFSEAKEQKMFDRSL